GLEPDAPYADAVVHADGLISLQYRPTKGGATQEIQAPLKAPAALRLERTGDLFTLFVAAEGGAYQAVGSGALALPDPVDVGLGACSHDARFSTRIVFSNVGFDNPGLVPKEKRVRESRLEVLSIESGRRETVYVTRDHIEAPNWSRDGASFLFNSNGS